MSDQPDALMLFAAGFGTRMGALTAARPKPMIEVAGQPLIGHALAQASDVDLRVRLANLHYKPESLESWLQARGIETILEAPDILETGGGLKAARETLGGGPVYTMNTDAVWQGPPALTCLAKAWRPEIMDGLLLTIPKARAIGHAGTGDFALDTDGRLQRGGADIYTGAQIIRTERLAEIAERAFSLNRLWDLLLAEGRLFGTPYPGRWCDVGRPEGIAAAEAMLSESHV